MSSKKVDPRAFSRVVMDGNQQAPSRAMLRAVGFTDADFEQPADRHRFDLGERDALQHAHRGAGA